MTTTIPTLEELRKSGALLRLRIGERKAMPPFKRLSQEELSASCPLCKAGIPRRQVR